MGANFITVYGEGENPREVYYYLCDEAARENGNSYSGDINMSSGFEVRERMPLTREDAEAYAEKNMDTVNKWEAFAAVCVGKPTTFKKSTKTLTITVTHMPHRELEDPRDLNQHVKGATVDSFELLKPWTAKSKMVKTATAGSPKWVVRAHGTAGMIVAVCATKSEATAAAKEYATERPNSHTLVMKEVLNEQNEVAHDSYVCETTWSCKVKAKLNVPVGDLEPTGWLFFGSAAC